jgi:hypothetical protein
LNFGRFDFHFLTAISFWSKCHNIFSGICHQSDHTFSHDNVWALAPLFYHWILSCCTSYESIMTKRLWSKCKIYQNLLQYLTKYSFSLRNLVV